MKSLLLMSVRKQRILIPIRFASSTITLTRGRYTKQNEWNIRKRNQFITNVPKFSALAEPIVHKSVPFLLADIGEGIAEVELLQWFVEKGEKVSQFDRVCEVQSDKATVEITSRYDGVVKSLDGVVGDMIKVGRPLMHVLVKDCVSKKEENIMTSKHKEEARLIIPSVPTKFSISPKDEKRVVLTSPAVRKISKDNNIDLTTVVGTGPKGRVLKSDILSLMNQTGDILLRSSDEEKYTTPKISEKSSLSDVESIPIRGYNRLMIKSMESSLQIPHMTFSDEINITDLLKHRSQLKNTAESMNIKLSYLPFAIKALSLALHHQPILNGILCLESMAVKLNSAHNIGVAMDTPRGLAVPVIKDCQQLSVWDIAKELHRLHHVASNNSLSQIEISNATFSISNIGSFGGTYMSPIVTPPQLAIGAMGRIRRIPRFIGDTDKVEEAHVMNVSWGADHRVIDGGTIARFNNKWKHYMENPYIMMMDMK